MPATLLFTRVGTTLHRHPQEAGVPVTNYGLLLSYAHSPAAVERALRPWGLTL